MKLTWDDVYDRVACMPISPKAKLYGVPRGGSIVAALLGRAVDSPEQADFIVDDLVDSGKTREKYQTLYVKPFVALIDKQQEGISEWVVMPWEQTAQESIEDNITRQLQFIGEDVTLRETYKVVSCPCTDAFSLQAEKDFVDSVSFTHQACTHNWLCKSLQSPRF